MLLRIAVNDAFPDAYAAAVQTCQAPVTTGRRIGVVSPTGGAGASTVTAAMGAFLAGVRGEQIAALDLSTLPSGLMPRLPADQKTPVDEQERAGLGQLSDCGDFGAEELDLLRLGAEPMPRLRRLTYVPTEARLSPAEHRELDRALSQSFAVTVSELTREITLPGQTAVPGGAESLGVHALVVAMSPSVGDISANTDALRTLHSRYPGVPMVPVLVNSRKTPARTRNYTAAALRRILRELTAKPRLRYLATDRHLATGARLSVNRIGEKRRLQLAQLTAAAFTQASPGGRQ